MSGLRGALTHPGQNGEPRGNFDTTRKNFGPRIGLAYRLSPQTAVASRLRHLLLSAMGHDQRTGVRSLRLRADDAWVSSLDGVTPLNRSATRFRAVLLQHADLSG